MEIRRGMHAGREEAAPRDAKRYVRVLEAVTASRTPEELLREADVAAHGADGGGSGSGAGHRCS
jgi:hypothetical protein